MSITPGRDELLFLPLGGAGEIGMNMNLYGHAGKWLMVDLGITFGDERTPGVEVIMPDPAFIAERRHDLVGLVLTHAHEDHLGAVQYLWPQLRCPVYATPFTAAVLNRKLRESGLAGEVPVEVVPMSGAFSVGPFEIELVTLTHSIPEPNAVVVRTRLGAVLHTGDWKFDPEPLVGPVSDEAALRRLGEAGVLAMIGDSTNALVEGQSGSEAEVRRGLHSLIGQFDTRIAVACFASNVARLETIAKVAMAHDRQVALVGRSMWRIVEAAKETGYLSDLPEFVTEHDVGYLPREKTLLICTGSQGEPRSALSRIARRDHPSVALEAGDVAIFSSRRIPGNEKAIGELQNDLVKLGVKVVTDSDHFIHVSGHPARDELAAMYHMVRPRIAVPVHGEARHLAAHARLAEDCQVGQTVVPDNGSVIRLAPGPAEVVGEVQSGRLGLDGHNLIPLDAGRLKVRHRMVYNGAAVATLVLDGQGRFAAAPQVTVQGVFEVDDVTEQDAVVSAVRQAVEGLPPGLRRDDETVKEAARLAVRRALQASHGKKPVTQVHLVRI
jgi:ribonuclease J